MSKLSCINLAACLLLATISTNCASQSTKTTQQKMDEVLTNITQMIGNAECTSDKQCASIPIGAKPCGGPWSYRAYSTAHTDSEKLKTLVLHHKTLNKKYNQESGLMSDCAMAMEPAVACVNRSCKFVE